MKDTNWFELAQGVCILCSQYYLLALMIREGTPFGEAAFLSVFGGVIVGYLGFFLVVGLIAAIVESVRYVSRRFPPKP